MPPAPAAGGPGAPPGAGPVQLTPQDFAILDAAFTPPVIKVLQKVLHGVPGGPEIAAMLEQYAAGPPPAAPMPRPQTGLGNVGGNVGRQPFPPAR